ncbi:PREDICTED: ankyrin repeat domain-containing protein 13C-like [Camelina sativa]|uniref:Ankyrin repeat domain-containing protein 13C-like n=1 Tax=Camelina sativa TaxID=90675 RepID=A0ABM0WQ63_CAMSA|nr:PREDICTED: ankyrin repeat domain-containing protein 13C-like [Camelina sativa]
MSRPSSASAIRPEDYAHSPVHYAVVLGDHGALTRLLSSLPKLGDPEQIRTESDSLSQERVADQISALLDRRDVPSRETPLHLAVRLDDIFAARAISSAGGDISLQNASGWNPLQEAFCRRNSEVMKVLLRHHHRLAWCKWRRRLPRLIAVLRRMRDFYMEISFHFESSVIPFVGKIAPSDTYKIWKRDGNLRADTTLAGFDGLKIQRRRHSSFVKEDRDWISVGRKSVDVYPSAAPPRPPPPSQQSQLQPPRRSMAQIQPPRRSVAVPSTVSPVNPPPSPQIKEKEFVKSLHPSVWLTEQFPLKTEELLPLLDILANKVKAVARMRDLLTTKFPPGTFPVKLSIPVVPTVKVVITFTKFVELPPAETFYTPLSSPRFLNSANSTAGEEDQSDDEKPDARNSISRPSTWLRLASGKGSQRRIEEEEQQMPDPFAIPIGYKWTSMSSRNNNKSGNNNSKMKKSKSTKRSK